jgi:hypothetical protein
MRLIFKVLVGLVWLRIGLAVARGVSTTHGIGAGIGLMVLAVLALPLAVLLAARLVFGLDPDACTECKGTGHKVPKPKEE